MKHVLVTGGGGYVGSVLVNALLKGGAFVTVLDNHRNGSPRPETASDPRVNWVVGDVRNTSLLSELCAAADAVVHLAAIVGYPACDAAPDEAVAVNLDATKQLCSLLRPNQLLVFASTASVYGRVANGHCSEETRTAPESLYAKTKAQAEASVLAAGGVVLRPVTAFGQSPQFRWDLLVHHFVSCAASSGVVDVYEADARRPLVHVRDITQAIMLCLSRPTECAGRVFNVVDPELSLTKGQLALRIANYFDARVTLRNHDTDPDARDYLVTGQPLADLGFAPGGNLDATIHAIAKLEIAQQQ